MNRRRKFLLASLAAVVVMVGLVALNLSVGAAFAQTPTATPTAPAGPGGQGHGGPGRGPAFGRPGGADVLNAMAQALGMTTQDLTTQLRAGKTLADLAQAKGVSQDAVKQAIATAEKAGVDAAVTAGRLTADQAAQAKQRIDQAVAGMDLTKPGLGFGRGPALGGVPQPNQGSPLPNLGGPGRGPAFGRPGGADVLNAVAQALSMTTQDLTTQLRAGKTLADLAQAKGVSQDVVKQAIATAEKAGVDAAVTAGWLTADQAAQAKQRIDQAVAGMDLTKPGLGFGFGHGFEFRGPKGTAPTTPNGTTPTTPNGRPTTPFRGRPGPNGPAAPTAPSGSSL